MHLLLCFSQEKPFRWKETYTYTHTHARARARARTHTHTQNSIKCESMAEYVRTNQMSKTNQTSKTKSYIRLPFLTFKNSIHLSVRTFLKTQFCLYKLMQTSVGKILKWFFIAVDHYSFVITSHGLKEIAMVTSMSLWEVTTEQKCVSWLGCLC